MKWMIPLALLASLNAQIAWSSTQEAEEQPSTPASASTAQSPVERELSSDDGQVALYGEAVSTLSLMGLQIVKENERVKRLYQAYERAQGDEKKATAGAVLRREIGDVCMGGDDPLKDCFERWQAMNGITLNAIAKAQTGARVEASNIKQSPFIVGIEDKQPEQARKPFVPTAKDLDQMVQAELNKRKDGKITLEQWRRSMQGFLDEMPMASNKNHKKPRPEDYYKIKLIPRDPKNLDPQGEQLVVIERDASGKPVLDKDRYEAALKGMDESKNQFYKKFSEDMRALAKIAEESKDKAAAPSLKGAERFVRVPGDKNYYQDENRKDLSDSQKSFMTSRNQIASRMKELREEEKGNKKSSGDEGKGRETASATKQASGNPQPQTGVRESRVEFGGSNFVADDRDPERQDLPIQGEGPGGNTSSYSLYLDQTDLFDRVQNYLQFPVEQK